MADAAAGLARSAVIEPDESTGLCALVRDLLVRMAKLHFIPPAVGIWGQSGCEVLKRLQLEINFLLAKIQKSCCIRGALIVGKCTAAIVSAH